MNFAILKNLANPSRALVALGSAVLFFDLSYYAMAYLPGEKNLMCVIGAGLTTVNMIFSLILSLMFGIVVSGVVSLYKQRKVGLAASSASGIGFVVGAFTVFCTACTIPVFTVLGAAVSLSFFTTYELYFKIVSMILMLYGLYLLNKQLKEECQVCKV